MEETQRCEVSVVIAKRNISSTGNMHLNMTSSLFFATVWGTDKIRL